MKSLALREEPPPSATVEALLGTVMERGRLLAPHPPLAIIRNYCAAQIASLPADVRRLRHSATYPVSYSQRLVAPQRAMDAHVAAIEVGAPTANGGHRP